MDRRRSLLKIAALRSERERQAGGNIGDRQSVSLSSITAFIGAPVPIGTRDFTLEYFGNAYWATSGNSPLIFNNNSRYPYGKGCLLIYGDSKVAVQWVLFEMPSSGAPTDDSILLSAGDRETPFHFVVTRKGTTVKAYFNGELKATKEQSAVKDLGDFRLGMSNGSNMVMSRIYNYALSAEEVAALYNDGDPAGYILPQNLKNIKDMAFTSKTFEFDMDSPYYQRVLESGELESGRKYRVDYVVEEWDIAPAVIGSCGISCGVLSTVGTQYWPNISAAKLGENQYVVVDTKETGTPYMFVYASNPSDTYTSRRLKVTVHSVKMLGCVAEYLPQNLVGQWHEKPFEITGITTYTWTVETDPTYYQELLLGRFIQTGAVVMIKGSVSDYQSGEPFVYVGNRQAMIPAQNGSFTLKVINNRDNIDRIYYYGGTHLSDRRITITIDSVELIPDVALSWLDSARKFPLNDEYLPPLLEPIVISDETPIRIMGENSYTWTGVDDPNYSYIVRVSRPFTIGQLYKIRFVVSNWEAGNSPFIKIGTTGSYYPPDFNGNGTYEIYATPNGTPYSGVYVYAGLLNTDRRMTITVDSIEPIVEHSYDLTANGTPEIIIK